MPVTAKLSRKFYEKFGDELTNELVGWFNQVDTTYRGELRDLNELNFARFDAKLGQRAAELDAKLEQRTAQLDAKLEQRIAEVKGELHAGLAMLEGRLLARIGVLEGGLIGRIGMVEGRLTRLTVLLWATLLVTLAGILRLP
jgi:ABC-type phosphate transport system auxiliary subunit